MKYRPLLSLSFLTLAIFSGQAQAAPDFFPSSIFCQKVSDGRVDDAINQLTDQITAQHSSVIAASLKAAYAIGPTKHAITALQPVEICASGLALRKNDYSYLQLLETFQLTMANGAIRMLPILFQTSSVQGHEGVGLNPWSAVPRAELLRIADEQFASLDYSPTTAANLRDLLSQNLAHNPGIVVEEGSTSIVPILAADGTAKYYVAGDYFRAPNPNPYVEVSGSRGVVLRRVGTGWEVANFGSLYSFYQMLDEAMAKSAPASNLDEAQTQKLIEISK